MAPVTCRSRPVGRVTSVTLPQLMYGHHVDVLHVHDRILVVAGTAADEAAASAHQAAAGPPAGTG